mgnify:CR=1 FL=1|jgi:hypothetical protein
MMKHDKIAIVMIGFFLSYFILDVVLGVNVSGVKIILCGLVISGIILVTIKTPDRQLIGQSHLLQIYVIRINNLEKLLKEKGVSDEEIQSTNPAQSYIFKLNKTDRGAIDAIQDVEYNLKRNLNIK